MTPRLVFDIETVGVEFESLDEKAQELLLAYAETEEERANIKDGLGFSPLTGQVVAVGILNPDTDKGAVYYQMPDKKAKEEQDGDIHYIPRPNEKELLKSFWDAAAHYNQFVSFAGHSFDCPYLMVRSAIAGVKPTRNLMHNRYYDQPHIDLLDRLTNFGAMRGRRSLHMWCQAFGISSPKANGVTGNDVAKLFKEKKYLDIARYCYDDVKATKELLDYWEKYFR